MQKHVMSLVGFSSASEIAAYKTAFPSMHYELSYKMSEQLLSEVSPMLAGRIASVHACCPALPVFPNFGSHDEQVIAQSYDAICKSFETARSCNADIVVLHPGYVCDRAMPSSNAARKKLLDDPSFSRYIVHADGAICGADYPNQDIYRYHAVQAFKQLEHVAQVAKTYGVKLAVENLNPRVGYLFQTPWEMERLAALQDVYLCLDVGHLWISSFVYDFPYLPAIQRIIETDKVVNCHLHSNATNTAAKHFSDDHHTFDKYGFPARQVLELLAGTHANLTLEMVEDFDYNTRFLLKEIAAIQHGGQE